MKEKIIRQLHDLIEERNNRLVQLAEMRTDHIETIEERKVIMHSKRGAEIVRSLVEGDIIRSLQIGTLLLVDYVQHVEQLIRMKNSVYMEEQFDYRRAVFENGELVNDKAVTPFWKKKRCIDHRLKKQENDVPNDERFVYNRRDAVRYAERWWNGYNPSYNKFNDNCTNFISQCLRAGGAPMIGHPNRTKGWWYQSGNWSFSWSVAHAFRWHLSGAKTGLRGQEKQHAQELEPGDVICYDFTGDGRWQHTTIIVAKDPNGEPLVNAQSTNSRMRYWTYEDSTAWTPKIQYKFFHIVD